MATNTAAWILAHNEHPLQVKTAPMGSPETNQVLVKNHAIGINPVEGKIQTTDLHKDKMNYPCIFGEDLAGEVVAVGPGVTTFKAGDRVAGSPAGFLAKRNEEKAYQAYTIMRTDLITRIPDDLTFEKAAVIPLGLSTASAGLFNPDALNLQLPTEPAQVSTGKVVLVWGGASSVGSNAIQLAVAAGYEVISTASPKNFDMVKKLGASHVFDYHSPSVVADLLAALDDKPIAGVYDAIGWDAHAPCMEFASKAAGVKFIATTIPGWSSPPEGVTIKHIFALSITFSHVAESIWVKFLPKALAAGAYIAAPEPFVFGKGLESLQGAMDHVRLNGNSAQKTVVSL